MNEENQKPSPANPWAILALLGLLVVVIALMSTPVIMKASKNAPMTTATSNAKQVFYLLIDFDQDYGQFPGDATAILPSKDPGMPNIDLRSFKGKYSNDYLGQFIAAGYTKSEEVFVTPLKEKQGRTVDDVIQPRERILEAGECGFSYVKDQSTSDNSGRPVLLAPMAGEGFAFDPVPYNGKAVVLRIDGAVKQLLLEKDTHRAKIGGGKTIFEGGEDTVWGKDGFDPSLLVHPAPAPDKFKKGSSIAIITIAIVIMGLLGIVVVRKRRKRNHA